MENIVIVGSSGHAKVVIDIVEQAGRYRIAGLIDAFRPRGEETLGYAVLGTERDLPQLIDTHGLAGVLVAIGDNHARETVTATLAALAPGLPCVSAVHPSACIGKASTIGAGTVVMAGAVINPCCTIGEGCIVNTNASLDHDGVMEDFSSLAPGVVTGGNCRIGQGAAVGLGAMLRHRIAVGEHSVVGAGAVVLRDVAPYTVAYGNPARRVRDRAAGERYL
ncbi:transferase [Burkholderia stabilis]|uniref:acetyltransferase n=1 Tax=Burkholderia stabilis TaxID=95485 RepID=UPI0008519827|nr:acetyltransferase [Burkholderia stabilis]AOR67904.1 transferase [Burkholderia stabilis]HDR9495056.1 acetyltransferase [Burkholderia stabilis]HDR9525700.1 acetyltransferase [Burkholderia stabilis]HDR9534295.1 acetyltransferase [Burkholderia stabilis]HDR9542076.1 acetyltransferase [Burkholderia stabilis]